MNKLGWPSFDVLDILTFILNPILSQDEMKDKDGTGSVFNISLKHFLQILQN
jgi:hypothetical protein